MDTSFTDMIRGLGRSFISLIRTPVEDDGDIIPPGQGDPVGMDQDNVLENMGGDGSIPGIMRSSSSLFSPLGSNRGSGRDSSPIERAEDRNASERYSEEFFTPPVSSVSSDTSRQAVRGTPGSYVSFSDEEGGQNYTPVSRIPSRLREETHETSREPPRESAEIPDSNLDETCYMAPFPRSRHVSTPYPRSGMPRSRDFSRDSYYPSRQDIGTGRPMPGIREYNPRGDSNLYYNDRSQSRDRAPPYVPLYTPEPPRQTSDLVRARKEKTPDKFDDKTWEWEDYLAHFMSVARWNGWSNAEKAEQLAMSLRGKAQTILGDLSEYEIRNFEALKAALARRYCPTERRSAYRNDFRNRKRKREESIFDYACALRRLAAKAHPQLAPLDRDAITVDQFTFGLGSQEMMKHVQFGHPETLDAAIDLAIEFESFESVQVIKKPPSSRVAPIAPDATPNVAFDKKCSQQTSIEKELAKLVKVSLANADAIDKLSKTLQFPANEIKNKKTQNRNVTQNYIQRPNRTIDQEQIAQQKEIDRRNGACFRCSEKGHFALNCPQNPRNQGSGINQEDSNLNANSSCLGPIAQPR